MLGLKEIPYKVENSWYTGKCMLTSYELEELLGTKICALYQHHKGRDLFDLYWAMAHQNIDIDRLIFCYRTYMEYSADKPPTQKQFLAKMEEKMTDSEFLEDIHIILKPGLEYNNDKAWEFVKGKLIMKI